MRVKFYSHFAVSLFVLLLVSPLAFASHDFTPPALDLSRNPVFPVAGDSVLFEARAADESGIHLIEIVFKLGDGLFLSALCPGSSICLASTPRLAAGTQVYYFAKALDASNLRNEQLTPLFSFIVQPSLPPSPPSGDLVVVVKDCADSSGIAGAFVSAGGFQTRTGAGGATTPLSLPPGSYTVSASAYGYAPRAKTTFVNSGATTAEIMCLNRLPAGDTIPPLVSVSRNPLGTVFEGQSVVISATSSDASGIAWTQVSYSVNGGLPNNVACTANFCSSVAGPFLAGTVVNYSASAADGEGNAAFTPSSSFTVAPGSATPTPTTTPTSTPGPTTSPTPTPTVSPTPSPTPGPSAPNPGASCAVFLNSTNIQQNQSVQVNVSVSNYSTFPPFAQINCGNGFLANAVCTPDANQTNGSCVATCSYSSSGLFAIGAKAGGVTCFPASIAVTTPAITPLPAETGLLVVRAEDFDSGISLRNARINVNGDEKTTNLFGEALYRLANGTYNISASADNYNSATENNTLVRNASITIKVIKLRLVDCDFAVEEVAQACDGNTAWIAVRAENRLAQSNRLDVSYTSPLAINGSFNESFAARQNKTLNFTASLPAAFTGTQAAILRFKGTNVANSCRREITFNFCSSQGLVLRVRDQRLTSLPQSRICTTVEARNRAPAGTFVELSSIGAFDASFSQQRFFLGPQETNSVEYCINVPSGADGSSAFLVRATSSLPTVEVQVFLSVRGRGSFAVNYTGCVSGNCSCVPITVDGREILSLQLTNNGIAGNYYLRVAETRPGPDVEPVQHALLDFGTGSRRLALLDINSARPLAGDYVYQLALETGSGSTAFEHLLCLRVPVQISFKAQVMETGIIVPRDSVVAVNVLVENKGNVFTNFTLNHNSPLVTPTNTGFTLAPETSRKAEFNIDARNATAGSYSVPVQVAGRNGSASLAASFNIIFEIVSRSASGQRTVLKGLDVRQVEEIILPEQGDAFLQVVLENNNAHAVDQARVYVKNLPPGIISGSADEFALKPFEQRIAFIKLSAISVAPGVYTATLRADSPRESAERPAIVRVGRRGVELLLAVSQTPLAYSFGNETVVQTSFIASNQETEPVSVAARLEGLGQDWVVAVNPPTATIPSGAEQLFQVRAVSPLQPTRDYNATFVLSSPDGRARAVPTRIAPLEASTITGFVIFSNEALLIALVLLMLLLAAVLFLAARGNVEEAIDSTKERA